MIFGTIRIVFFVIIFAICVLLIWKSRLIHKRRWYLSALAVTIVLTTLSAFVPIENAFITFSSPTAAFEHINTGNVKLIVNGEETDFVVAEKGNADSYLIIPKAGNGWKMGLGTDTKRIAHKFSNGVSIEVYQYKNTGDYYITVLNTEGGMLEISDNHNSEFSYLDKQNASLNETFYTYYAYVKNFDAQYILTVNGKTISII